jgi:hypothetical protein
MRNNYVGDVGDYYKYALLRHLSGLTARDMEPPLSLGVVWYLYTEPCNPNGGNHRSYLENENRGRYESLDPDLYAAMAPFSDVALRNVEEVARSNVLPSGTCFFSDKLSFSGLSSGTQVFIQDRKDSRDAWLVRALDATQGAELIFADPDNGLEVASTAVHRDRGAKYAFYGDLLPFWNRGQSLVIYQHRDFTGAEQQAARRKAELCAKLDGAAFVDVVHFPSFSGRMFFVAAKPDHAEPLRARLQSFRVKAEGHVGIAGTKTHVRTLAGR